MGSIGDILARRAAMSGATLRPRRLPLGSHTMSAHGQAGRESPTAVVTDSQNARAMALLRGIEPQAIAALKVASEVIPVSSGLDGALANTVEALERLRSVTVAGALTFGFAEAARFAGRVEEISRTVEYLQVIAAHAVERTRTQAQHARPSSAAGTGWQTGWTDPGTTDPGVSSA